VQMVDMPVRGRIAKDLQGPLRADCAAPPKTLLYILCQYERKYERSREDHQIEKCQLTLELRQCWRRKSGGTRLRISLPPSSACEIADTYCCRDRVKIAFLGSPFSYPQISSVRFSCP